MTDKSPDSIKIDGKEYIRVDKTKPQFINQNITISDGNPVIGIGSVELKSGTWIRSKIGVEYLQKTVNILRELETSAVEIIFSEGYPVIIGEIKDGVAQGVFIAPRLGKQ